ncbi:MAG TPA: zinc ribbon domain-containing protein [bacterium]|nr:zinc ribbon domain-containing protein [bacterium]HPN44720.1 zinc ribbon domain-containing protein [bacterium]
MKTYITHSFIEYIIISIIFLLLFILVFPAIIHGRQQESVYCPQCGTRNSVTAKFCSNCGYRFTEQGEKADTLQVKMTVPLPDSTGSQPSPKTAVVAIPDSLHADTETEYELKAKAYYITAVELFEKGNYQNAIIVFDKVIKDYPNSKYASAAPIMIKSCYTLKNAPASKVEEPVQEKKSDSGSSFFAGMLGGIAGVLLLVAILLANVD